MDLPHSDSHDVDPTAVLLPLRSLRDGKLRLASSHDADTRARLIDHMASTVVAAAHDLDVLVVHEDEEVVDWAESRGARALRPTTPGLNAAITEGRDLLRTLGYERLIVAHGDLPLADDLRRVDRGSGMSIVSDRHGDGTNVLCLPTSIDFTFAYGPGSFAAHMEIATRLGIEPDVLHDRRLSWDVDHPDDLIGAGLEHLLSATPDPPRIST